jgi:hypothetical protein
MEKYWKNAKQPLSSAPATDFPTDDDAGSASLLSDYDRYRLTLLSSKGREGWESELRRYENDMPADVSPDTDIVNWWQVCLLFLQCVFFSMIFTLLGSLQRVPHSCTHCTGYPPYSCLFRTMRATFLSSKRNCRRSPFPSWVKKV